MQVDEVTPQAHTIVSPATFASLLSIGIAFDLAVNGQQPGAATAIFFALVAVLVRPWFTPGIERDALLAGAVLFAAFPVVRASEPLAAMDVLIATALLALAATRRDVGLIHERAEGLLRRAAHLPMSAVHVPAALIGPVAARLGTLGSVRTRALARAALIVVPVLAVFVALLASADRIFGDLLVPDLPALDLGGLAGHLGLGVLGTALATTLVLSARRQIPEPFTEEPIGLPSLRVGEWVSILAGIDLLFAVFVGVQFAFLFGGERSIELTEGLTYAEYARSGFFQLLVVAGLTAAVILASWDLGARTDRRQERTFRALVTVMVGLCGVILASAVIRLTLYQRAFGWTLARLAAYVAMACIAAVLAILLATIWMRARHLVIGSVLIAGLMVAAGVNALDPERFVAERNIARFDSTGKIDIEYLAYALGTDAVGPIVGVLESLPHPEAAYARDLLCERAESLERAGGDWRSANLARARARAALERAGITARSCARQ